MVDSDKNYFFVGLENPGTTPLDVNAAMLDAFGQDDHQDARRADRTGIWRSVSPEVVHATIGGPNNGRPDARRQRAVDADLRPDAGHSERKAADAWESLMA